MGKTVMLVKVETGVNSNKFYELTLDGDNVHARWGRVGNTGQSKTYPGGEAKFESLMHQKQRKGYKEVEVVGNTGGSKASSDLLRRASLKSLAKPDFTDDPRITKVIDEIVAANAHSIATTSGGKIELSDGQLRTPLGVIGRTSLNRANLILDKIDTATTRLGKVSLLEEYLTLVPQKVGHTRGWEDDLLTTPALDAQREFVKQLTDSLDFIETQNAGDDPEVGFRFSMGVVDSDDPRFRQVSESFAKTLNAAHPSRRYRLTGLYDITDTDEHMQAYFQHRDTKGNEQWMWHGTRVSNVLSVLAKGLYCPPATARHVTGRMFGNGIYLSRQSTKSLNYSGGVWAGQHLSQKAYMFSVQAVMGKMYAPSSYGGSFAKAYADYDSINVESGTAGVRNHEAVIWDTTQLNMRYLCEFSL